METANLDGEKHPKPRASVDEIKDMIKPAISSSDDINKWKFTPEIKAEVNILEPNSSLYAFEGFVYDRKKSNDEEAPISISTKNFFFKGSKLVNVKWVALFVVYVGKDTKIQKNGGTAKTKLTKIEKRLFLYMISLFVLQIVCAVFATILKIIFENYSIGKFEAYMKKEDPEYNVPVWLTFVRFHILLSNFIPISLVVSLEVVRVIQGIFTKNSIELKSQERNM